MRIEVRYRPEIDDGRAQAVLRSLRAQGVALDQIDIADVYLVDGVPGCTREYAQGFFCDPVAQEIRVQDETTPDWHLLLEITYKPGVANPEASSIRDALSSEFRGLPTEAVVQTARQFRLTGVDSDADASTIAGLLHNPLIQQAVEISHDQWSRGTRPPSLYPVISEMVSPPVEEIPLEGLDETSLAQVSRTRLLALDTGEMKAIQGHYGSAATGRRRADLGLPAEPTDVELEMLAQTWSEHCKHKIFAARIDYTDTTTGEHQIIDGLFPTYIKATTEGMHRDDGFLKSVFHDNSGVIEFDKETLLCFKAETHNSPSALDPYGGAITGIVGVNRDILGTGKGARPIFNTNVLCFGDPETPEAGIPEGLLHPRTVLDGVHRGIVDGGNQSGIPVVAGGFLFDESYLGKPLVFCGTGGVLPAEILNEGAWINHIDPGDLAVMVGGRIGKDGIHGATFSSLVLDESSPTSAVQIGEPITQKKMADFLLEARDLGLYKGITDNGAGGLSSSLGEMAEIAGGIDIHLDRCPLKYAGLASWEILVSESQERMSLSVDPERIDEFIALAVRRGVEASVVGGFTDSGEVKIYQDGQLVGMLSLEFLHDGLPQMQLNATWNGPRPTEGSIGSADATSIHDSLLAILADPSVASKEHLVRQYDHEVQAGSVVKPHCGPGADGPTDGAVFRPRYDSWQGATVTHGICPRYGDVDAYYMAIAAVDEAVRAHVALGGDPARMAGLDNFCWPDPVESDATPDGRFKLAQLVRTCRGLAEACRAYGLPLISGKDSMKNDATLGGKKVSIRPTLLVSLMGIIPDVRKAMTSDVKKSGDIVLLIGSDTVGLGGSSFERIHGAALGTTPDFDLPGMASLYHDLHGVLNAGLLSSIHDLSDGGLLVGIAECVIGGRLGANIILPDGSGDTSGSSLLSTCFGEGPGRFVATVSADSLPQVTRQLGADNVTVIGEVTTDSKLSVTAGDRSVDWPMADLRTAWQSLSRSLDGTTEIRTVADPPETTGPVGHEDASPQSSEISVSTAAPKVLVVTGYGINADHELGQAFMMAEARPQRVHVNDLLANPGLLDSAQIIGFPGGFSYGDHVGSGLMLAHRLRSLRSQIDRHRDSGGLIIGICNGFQVLVKLGILPDTQGAWNQEVSLVHNSTGVFEDSWVTVDVNRDNTSPWLRGLSLMDMPIRHGEGRFVAAGQAILTTLSDQNMVALTYHGRNPNGSVGDIAGITDRTGRVLGMMPHPEAYLIRQNHPQWTRGQGHPDGGLQLFRNAVLQIQGSPKV